MSDTENNPIHLDRRNTLAALAGATAFTFLGAGSAQAGTNAAGTTLADFESPAKFKVVWLVKRKPGLSVEEFRAAYLEHAQFIAKALGKDCVYYRLSFPDEQHNGLHETTAEEPGYIGPQVPVEWDCVTEMGLPNREVYDDQLKASEKPYEGLTRMQEHEQTFIDYKQVVSLYCKEYIFTS